MQGSLEKCPGGGGKYGTVWYGMKWYPGCCGGNDATFMERNVTGVWRKLVRIQVITSNCSCVFEPVTSVPVLPPSLPSLHPSTIRVYIYTLVARQPNILFYLPATLPVPYSMMLECIHYRRSHTAYGTSRVAKSSSTRNLVNLYGYDNDHPPLHESLILSYLNLSRYC